MYVCLCIHVNVSVFGMCTCVYKGVLMPVRACGDQKSKEGCLSSCSCTLNHIPLLESLTEAGAGLAASQKALTIHLYLHLSLSPTVDRATP